MIQLKGFTSYARKKKTPINKKGAKVSIKNLVVLYWQDRGRQFLKAPPITICLCKL